MFSSLPPLVFLCLGGKVAQYGVEKKKSPSWKGRESTPFTISVSRFTLLEKKKKKGNNFIGSRCWHCVVIEDGKSSPSRCSYKGIDGTQSPCDGSPLQLWEDSRSCVQPKMKSAWDFNMQLHQGLNLFVWCNFSPCRMHNIYLSYILRVERQVQIKHLKKILQFQESFKSTIAAWKHWLKWFQKN